MILGKLREPSSLFMNDSIQVVLIRDGFLSLRQYSAALVPVSVDLAVAASDHEVCVNVEVYHGLIVLWFSQMSQFESFGGGSFCAAGPERGHWRTSSSQ